MTTPGLVDHFFRHEYGKLVATLSRRVGVHNIDVFSRYHAEAAIAAEHCPAPTFEDTRWEKVVEYYSLLEQVTPSPLHRLNRAVAMAEWQGPRAGLAVLEDFEPPTWLTGSYQWAAVLADLHRRSGASEIAERYRDVALESAPTAAVKELLQPRLVGACT